MRTRRPVLRPSIDIDRSGLTDRRESHTRTGLTVETGWHVAGVKKTAERSEVKELSWTLPDRVMVEGQKSDRSDREGSSSLYNDVSSTRFEHSATKSFSKDKQTKRYFKKSTEGSENLKRREKQLVEPVQAEDRFFDQCVDKFIYQSYSTRKKPNKLTRPKLKKIHNRSLNSQTYADYSMDAASVGDTASFLGATDPFNNRRNARLPQLNRLAIFSQTSVDQREHSRLARLIYQNHPRDLMKPEKPQHSSRIVSLLRSARPVDACLITVASSVDDYANHCIDHSMMQDKSADIESKIKDYRYSNNLKIRNQTYNDYFDSEVDGKIVRFNIKLVRQSFQLYIVMRDEEIKHRDLITDMEQRLRDSLDKAKKSKAAALRKRLLVTATIRLAMLTETAIKHAAGWELIRFLKDTVREDWEWYYYKVPAEILDICGWSPSYQELLDRNIINPKRDLKFTDDDNTGKGNLGKDGLIRRKAFNGTGDPGSNPFSRKLWNPTTRRFSRLLKDAPIAFKLGDPNSPVMTKIMKEGEYSSYWFQCIERCLEHEDVFEMSEAGYICTLKSKPNKLVEKELRLYLYLYINSAPTRQTVSCLPTRRRP